MLLNSKLFYISYSSAIPCYQGWQKKNTRKKPRVPSRKKIFWWVLLFSLNTIHLRALRRNLQNSSSMNDVCNSSNIIESMCTMQDH